MNTITTRYLTKEHWASVSRIYADGLATGIATFETEVSSWKQWHNKHIESCRIVALLDDKIVGFAVLSKVSKREVYMGVAEVSVYVDSEFRRQHIAETLLKQLIIESEEQGFWTLQAGIFSKNEASIALHEKCGFRVVGVRKKIGQLHGVWHDNHFLERRSSLVN